MTKNFAAFTAYANNTAPARTPFKGAQRAAQGSRALVFRALANCKAAGQHEKSRKAERRALKSRPPVWD